MHRSLSCRLLSGFLASLLVWGTLPSRVVFAEEAPEVTSAPVSSWFVPEDTADVGTSEALEELAREGAEELVQAPESPESREEPGVAYSLAAPAGTEEKSAVTPQAISLPKAEGSIQGMGESFSPVLSSGTATFTVPIALPAGRKGVQPSLSLSYSSSSGNGEVGFGWGLGTPFIARQADRGIPRYVDQAAWHAEEDRFFYNGGQELVPVDSAKAEITDCGQVGCAPIPSELKGWQQYRARLEGGFLRFFRAPDAKRWVVQGKDGTRFDFGLLPAKDGPGEALSASASALQDDAGRVYRWLLTRMSDPHGSVVYYLYDTNAGQRYLRDLYYVSPHGACGLSSPQERLRCQAPFSDYGRRVRLVYEGRADAFTSYVSGWAITTAKRLRRIEVTSSAQGAGARILVRRYHLGYEPGSFHSVLASVEVEGRPTQTDVYTGIEYVKDSIDEGLLGENTVGPTLPPLRFGYTTQPSSTDAVPGFGGIDPAVKKAKVSPPHSVDEERADLFDVNSDGLPDLLVTDPARFRTSSGAPAAGVFFNGFEGPSATPASSAGTFSAAVPMALPSGLSSVLMLSNPNIVPMDIDADGRSDLLHMPRLANYGYFTPARSGDAGAVSPAKQGWRWAHVPRTLPAGFTDPRIDLSRDASHLRVFDVNHDRLIDVVKTTGNSIQTWLNLGWLPNGDGRFGSARYDAAKKSWVLSTAPLVSCLPHAGLPLDFADPEVRLGDLNGDGIQDLLRIRKGRVIYWPGRGAGQWGTTECVGGTFQGDSYVEMATPPMEVNPDLSGVYLADLNADGADDVVQVRFRDVDVWFNQAGQGFTQRITARGTPEAPDYAPRIRFADMDGTGTVDILYGTAKNWRWIDPMGGRRPRLLTSIDGGLGALTEIAYGSSAEDYLADLRAAEGCTGASCERFTWSQVAGPSAQRSDGSPVVSSVVRQVSTTDRFQRFHGENRSVTRYAYHDGHYDGVEMEFRGFGAADATAVGDASHPTGVTRTYFHQGRRKPELGPDKLADNPDEALKGLGYLTEVRDEAGRYLSSTLSTTTLRKLLVGRNGVAVSYAYGSRSYDLRWNSSSEGLRSGAAITLPTVLRGAVTEKQMAVRQRHNGFAVVLKTVDQVDNVGNVKKQTAWGRVQGEAGEDLPDESIVSVATPENLSTSASGWLWRTRGTLVLGHGTTVGLGDTTNTWNAAGDLVRASTRVEQSVTPAFGGDGQAQDLGAPAPEPMTASTAYDVWGNATASCAGGDAQTKVGCLRYGSVTYDAAYALVPETESLAVGRVGADFAYLTTKGEWDVGLGALTAAVDANGERSTVTYDGFGRLTSVTLPPVSGCGGMPSTRLRYELTQDPQTVPVSRMFTTALTSCTSAQEGIETIAYVDGLGRVRATLSTGEDAGRPWIKSGVSLFTARGTAWKAYQPEVYTGSPEAMGAVLAAPATPSSQASYDAFGRQVLAIAEDGATTETRYFALSTEVWDPNDLDSQSPHYLTPTTVRQDGHGRTIDQVLRNKQVGGSAVEYYRLWTDYRADGAIVRVRRAQTTTDVHRGAATVVGGRVVERTFTYDTVGRRIATTDPDTDNRADGASWRYLFNRVGDLAAVRDPRGCGQNYYYDHGGRLVGEQYVGCAEAQAHEGPADTLAAGVIGVTETTTAQPVDVRRYFDTYAGTFAPSPSTLEDFPADAGGVLGRQAGSADRGQRSVVAYDRRGNAIWAARQMALIPAAGTVATTWTDASPTETLTPPPNVAYDEAHTYVRTAVYDHANRTVGMVLPRDPDFDDAAPGPRIAGTLSFNPRGLPARASALMVSGGSQATATNGALSFGTGSQVQTQPVLQSLVYDRDGLVLDTTYGDDRGGTRGPTVTATRYDVRRRPTMSITARTSTGVAIGTERPLSAVGVPFAQTLTWDKANNLVAVHDDRLAQEWPAGHRPQSVTLKHDALYRVGDAAYSYSHEQRVSAEEGVVTSTSPYDVGTDWRDEQARTRGHDPMRTAPAPMVAKKAPDRVASLTWSYDWLGNMKDWGDDAHAFYERSIGSITNGADMGAGSAPAQRPSALYLASDLAGTTADRGGYVELDYGVSGNLVAMTVHAQCVDKDALTVCRDPGGADLPARRSALKAACACASEQHTQYRWDEVNRIAEARRYDRKTGSGSFTLAARQRYRYDGQNVRTVKQTRDPAAELPPRAPCATCENPRPIEPSERVALYIYPSDFERRGLVRDIDRYSADPLLDTETQYLVAGARIVWQKGDPVLGLDSEHRITLGLGDLIGTTAAVLDLRSGELIEHDTYYPNGARETYLTTPSATIAPEPQGFTGKEADEEVGLTYFGERYLIPRIGRWASPDPLAIHALGGGEAMNSYHYVSGNLLQARDPLGLDAESDARKQIKDRAIPVKPPQGIEEGQAFVLREEGDTAASQFYDEKSENPAQEFLKGTETRRIYIADSRSRFTLVDGFPVHDAVLSIKNAFEKRKADPLATAGAWLKLLNLDASNSYGDKELGTGEKAAYAGLQLAELVGPDRILKAFSKLLGVIGKIGKAARGVRLPSSRYPETAAHIRDAQTAGKPSELTIGQPGSAAGRRTEALAGREKVPGKDLDEYPPAMFEEGGAGASVRPISPADNRGAGACIGNQCRGLAPGTRVRIVVE